MLVPKLREGGWQSGCLAPFPLEVCLWHRCPLKWQNQQALSHVSSPVASQSLSSTWPPWERSLVPMEWGEMGVEQDAVRLLILPYYQWVNTHSDQDTGSSRVFSLYRLTMWHSGPKQGKPFHQQNLIEHIWYHISCLLTAGTQMPFGIVFPFLITQRSCSVRSWREMKINVVDKSRIKDQLLTLKDGLNKLQVGKKLEFNTSKGAKIQTNNPLCSSGRGERGAYTCHYWEWQWL